MHTHEPYSTRLARGTLLMIHSPTVGVRYAHLRRLIALESAGIAGVGLLAASLGWLGREPVVLLAGLLAVVTAAFSWIIRSARILYRHRRTPTMLLISEQGIGAILPNTSSLQFQWKTMCARTIHLQARMRAVPPQGRAGWNGEGWSRGLMLKGEGGRLYLTCDLDGYNELMEILADYNIPLAPPRRLNPQGDDAGLRSGLERRLWQARN